MKGLKNSNKILHKTMTIRIHETVRKTEQAHGGTFIAVNIQSENRKVYQPLKKSKSVGKFRRSPVATQEKHMAEVPDCLRPIAERQDTARRFKAFLSPRLTRQIMEPEDETPTTRTVSNSEQVGSHYAQCLHQEINGFHFIFKHPSQT